MVEDEGGDLSYVNTCTMIVVVNKQLIREFCKFCLWHSQDDAVTKRHYPPDFVPTICHILTTCQAIELMTKVGQDLE
jgi:hypothetical protein